MRMFVFHKTSDSCRYDALTKEWGKITFSNYLFTKKNQRLIRGFFVISEFVPQMTLLTRPKPYNIIRPFYVSLENTLAPWTHKFQTTIHFCYALLIYIVQPHVALEEVWSLVETFKADFQPVSCIPLIASFCHYLGMIDNTNELKRAVVASSDIYNWYTYETQFFSKQTLTSSLLQCIHCQQLTKNVYARFKTLVEYMVEHECV